MIAAGKIVQFNIECFVMAQLWILFEAELIRDWNFPTFLDVTWKANAFNSHLHHEMCKSNISSTRQTLMNIDNMGMSPAVFPRRTLSQYRNVVTDTVCGVYNNNEASISSDHSSYNNFHVPYWRL